MARSFALCYQNVTKFVTLVGDKPTFVVLDKEIAYFSITILYKGKVEHQGPVTSPVADLEMVWIEAESRSEIQDGFFVADYTDVVRLFVAPGLVKYRRKNADSAGRSAGVSVRIGFRRF